MLSNHLWNPFSGSALRKLFCTGMKDRNSLSKRGQEMRNTNRQEKDTDRASRREEKCEGIQTN
jgi:hypothetical protein